MQNRQSGAAHVPIMFFLILLVMFLGALGFAYVQQTKNSELIKARDEAAADAATFKKKELLIEDYVAAIGRVIGKPGSYEGEPGKSNVYDGATIEYPGLMNPNEVKKVMDDAAVNAGVATAGSLENLLGAMITKINAVNQRATDAELARDKALQDKDQTEQRFAQTETEASSNARENATNLEQSRSDFQAATDDKDRSITSLTDTVRGKDDQLASLREESQAREKELQGKISMLENQLSALIERQALIKPPSVADGKILVARNGIPTAFINLGRKDLLQPGTVFRIKSPSGTSVKGYAEVTRVEDERAEVRLYNFTDPVGNYATEGDLLYNDLYTPRVTRTIYLMGRFGAPYGKEQLTNLLRRLGNRVVSKMGPGVDTVVLGNKPVNEEGDGFADIEQSEEFKQANELRVEFTYLTKIADLIKL